MNYQAPRVVVEHTTSRETASLFASSQADEMWHNSCQLFQSITCVYVFVCLRVLAEAIQIPHSSLINYRHFWEEKKISVKNNREQNTKFHFIVHLGIILSGKSLHRHTETCSMYAELCTILGKAGECST